MATVMQNVSGVLSDKDIAEAAAQRELPAHIRFLDVARGSLGNLETQSHTWKDMGYLKGSEFQLLRGRIKQTQEMLSALIGNLTTP